jgi:hypothetical protein
MVYSNELVSILRQIIKDIDAVSLITHLPLDDIFYVDYSDKDDYIKIISTNRLKSCIVRLRTSLLCDLNHDIYDDIINKIDTSKISHNKNINYSTNRFRIINLYKGSNKYEKSHDILHLESIDDEYQILHVLNKQRDESLIFTEIKGEQEVKFGRFLSRLFNTKEAKESWFLCEEANKNKLIEKYVNSYKSYKAYIKSINKYISVVSGNDLIKWYHEDRYEKNQGTLSNSCMRYDKCQEYFNIYTDNDVHMLILKNEAGKLIGRSLLWETNEGKYMDRIYGQDHIQILFKKWATDNEYELRYDLGSKVSKTIKANLFGKFPYMDTFKFMYGDAELMGMQEVKITNIEPKINQKFHICNNTNGEFVKNQIYSE